MNVRPRVVLTTLFVCAFTGKLVADEIVLIPNATFKLPGGRVRGQISSETPAEVKIKPPTGAEQVVPTDQIASITYDGQPPSLALAESRESAGNLADAADLYKKAATEAASKPLAAQAANFGRLRVLSDQAFSSPDKADAVITELDAFLKANPGSRHTAPALELLIRLALTKNDVARAETALGELTAKVPSAADRSVIWKARIASRKGQYDQAIAELDRLLAAASADPAKAREIKLAKAEALTAAKKFEPGLAIVLEVIKESPPEAADVQAIAHNTLGDCYRAAGRPKDALIAYLQTDILYDKDKEQHPRALAQIAQIFRELKQDGRADEVQDRLKQLYPNSPYARGRATPK